MSNYNPGAGNQDTAIIGALYDEHNYTVAGFDICYFRVYVGSKLAIILTVAVTDKSIAIHHRKLNPIPPKF